MKMYLLALTFLYTSGYIYGNKPTSTPILYGYNQSDSQTNCTNGLEHEVDTAVFNGKIYNLSTNSNVSVHWSLQRKGNTPVNHLDRFDISSMCGVSKSCKIIDNSTLKITINIKASKLFSEAKVWFTLVWPDVAENSLQQSMPPIEDVADISGELRINGELVTNSSDCSHTLNETTLKVAFSCNNSQVQPCMIEITTNDSAYIAHGKGVAFLTKKYKDIEQQHIKVTIKNYLCGLDGQVIEHHCDITFREKRKDIEKSTDLGLIIGLSVGLLLGLLIGILAFVLYRKCQQRAPPAHPTVMYHAAPINVHSMDDTQRNPQSDNL